MKLAQFCFKNWDEYFFYSKKKLQVYNLPSASAKLQYMVVLRTEKY